MNAGVLRDRNSNVSMYVSIACSIVQIVMSCKSASFQPTMWATAFFVFLSSLLTTIFDILVSIACHASVSAR